jgi:acyl-CoA reductase-like NAD-dependent aldehyde dehydrogenase
MKVINPATEEIIKTIAEDSKEVITSKHNAARQAQSTWKQVDIKERIAAIQKFSDLLESNKETLAHTLTSEMGKPVQQARNEINSARGRIKFFIENSEKYLSDEWLQQDAGMSEKISFEPLGVIANISAWNYPYLVGVNVFIPALIAGNAVLYKPSEFTTLTGLEIERLMHEAGIPKDVFQIIIGAKDAGEALLELPLDGYFFTGSYKTGKYIYEKVASKMVPCGLELGGKDPLYVTDEISDIEGVATGTADGAFYNNGQSCCAVERIYVHEKVYDKYVEEFVKEVKSYKMGNPTEEGVYIAPLSRAAQVSFLESQVKDALDKGASLLAGGKKVDGKGFYFEPTVLTDVNHSMSVMKDESFGPIIGIMKVKNDEEAINLMLDSEYGLTSSVYSDTFERAKPILAKMDSGTVYWNCCDRLSPQLPWSGRRNSGFGSTLSYIGIRAFVKPKAYHLRGNLK